MEFADEVIDNEGVVVDLADLDCDHALRLLAGSQESVRRAEARVLRLAAHWADLHSGEALHLNSSALPGTERARRAGADGTPEIGEFAPAEFAAVAGLSKRAANKLIADAVDLRHRFPRIWERVCAANVPMWVCRRIATLCRPLDLAAAWSVDAAVADYVSSLSPYRLITLVEARIAEADPEAAEARARFEEARRFVRTGQSNVCGIKTLMVRADAGDVIIFTAMCDRIAQILAWKGDSDPLDIRRSKAVGILGNPTYALKLLAEYEGREADDDTASDDCGEPHHPYRPPTPDPLPDQQLLLETDLHPEDLDDEPEPTAVPEPDYIAPDLDPTEPPADEWHLTETDLHPAEIDPQPPRNYANDLENILIRHKVRLRDLLPKTTVYLHLNQDTVLRGDGVIRVEDGGPIIPAQLNRWLRGKHITITPVIDPANTPAIDAYETSTKLREALRIVYPAETFPYATYLGRKIDHDHAVPYRPPPDGPPGQTGLHQLHPLQRFSHRLKTHDGWQVRIPELGTVLWRSPHGWHFLINPAGTHPLGNGPYARTLWDAASKIKPV